MDQLTRTPTVLADLQTLGVTTVPIGAHASCARLLCTTAPGSAPSIRCVRRAEEGLGRITCATRHDPERVVAEFVKARELTEVAHPFLQDLFELTRGNVHLCIREQPSAGV